MLAILVITISILVFLVFVRNLKKTKENFRNNFRRKINENFANPSIKNVHMDTEIEEGSNNGEESNNGNESNNGEESNNGNESNNGEESNNGDESNNGEESNNSEESNNNGKEGACLFGCEDKGASQYKTPEPGKAANLDVMMKTFEETEKICEAIERKDKERKDRDAIENVDRQLQLNKKFLVQQNAQNKQIEDLQKLVKDMQFDEDMKKVAIEKCSGKSDDCLSDKESRMNKILKMKEDRKQNMKVNLNIDPFGEEFKKKLMESLKLPESEMNKIMNALKNGSINLEDIIQPGQNNINNNNNNNNTNNNNNKGGNGSYSYDKSCPNCKVNLADYIDRCKIPCRKCRDPAWKCPQDISKK